MNTSDIDDSRFSAEALRLPEDALAAIRMKIYHSGGDGYYVFRNFISPEVVKHMRELWVGIDARAVFGDFPGNDRVVAGCPDTCAVYPDGSTIFYNFPFAEPLDEATREVAICVHMLRNRLSGRNAFADLNGPRTALNYRVTLNKNYENWIAPHRDFLDYERRLEKGQYDPSRLQATLFLSKKGVDYDGSAFSFQRNDGREVLFGSDVPIEPGDLVVWKYTNLHGVSQVTTPPGGIGLLRLLFPIQELAPADASIAPSAPAPVGTAECMPYAQLLKLAARRGARGVARRLRSITGLAR